MFSLDSITGVTSGHITCNVTAWRGEDEQGKTDGWGSAGSDGRRSGGRAGVRLAAGPTRARGPACCGALAGCWLGRVAEQAEPAARPSSSFPFFVFFFFFLDLNSNLVWVFEFKMGAPNSLEF